MCGSVLKVERWIVNCYQVNEWDKPNETNWMRQTLSTNDLIRMTNGFLTVVYCLAAQFANDNLFINNVNLPWNNLPNQKAKRLIVMNFKYNFFHIKYSLLKLFQAGNLGFAGNQEKFTFFKFPIEIFLKNFLSIKYFF